MDNTPQGGDILPAATSDKKQNWKPRRIYTGEIVTPGGLYCLCGTLLSGKRIEQRMCFRCGKKADTEDKARQPKVRQECFNKQELYSRGWTRSLMRHLGAPDHIATKPGFSCQEHLYERKRVEKLEWSLCVNHNPLPGKMMNGRLLAQVVNELAPSLTVRNGKQSKGQQSILNMVLNGSAERLVAAKYKVSRQSVSRIKLAALQELERAGVWIPAKLIRWRRSPKGTNPVTMNGLL